MLTVKSNVGHGTLLGGCTCNPTIIISYRRVSSAKLELHVHVEDVSRPRF